MARRAAHTVLQQRWQPSGLFAEGCSLLFCVRADPVPYQRINESIRRTPHARRIDPYNKWKDECRDAFIVANPSALSFDRCEVATIFDVAAGGRLPDGDNLYKGVIDALAGYAWRDDNISVIPADFRRTRRAQSSQCAWVEIEAFGAEGLGSFPSMPAPADSPCNKCRHGEVVPAAGGTQTFRCNATGLTGIPRWGACPLLRGKKF